MATLQSMTGAHPFSALTSATSPAASSGQVAASTSNRFIKDLVQPSASSLPAQTATVLGVTEGALGVKAVVEAVKAFVLPWGLIRHNNTLTADGVRHLLSAAAYGLPALGINNLTHKQLEQWRALQDT